MREWQKWRNRMLAQHEWQREYEAIPQPKMRSHAQTPHARYNGNTAGAGFSHDEVTAADIGNSTMKAHATSSGTYVSVISVSSRSRSAHRYRQHAELAK